MARPIAGDAEPIHRLRTLALSLPEAAEQEAWGEPTFRVRRKIFAMYASGSNHHGSGSDSVWVKAPLGVQEVLVRQEPETYFVPPYVGVKGWVGARLSEVDDEQLRSLLVQSYCLIAPARLRAAVED